ncbi:FAD binding domain protein [Hypoxylon cercidicola]|nr:FAD binding domain protein [Hypoxylon cercidicola]
MNKWPGFIEKLKSISWPSVNHFKKFDGTLIGVFPVGDPEFPSIPLNRQGFHHALQDYTKKLGIPIRLSTTVVEYFETAEHGGVRLADGERLAADIVVAADEIGSRSRELVIGNRDRPVSSGFAVYRASFPIKPIRESNPIIAKEFENIDRRVSVHMGPDAHVVIGKTEDEDYRVSDDILRIALSDDALSHVEGWTPFLTELINSTPNKIVVDWKLMWRDPQRTWASPQARVIQIGDAAHPFLPTSGSGATMGIENAYSLTTCLQLSGKWNAPLGVRVHNHLRFECVPKIPETVGRPVGSWVLKHDPEQYALDNYGNCVNHLVAGAPFGNTNMPPGYVFKPWTVRQLLHETDNGGLVLDEGDWS